MSKKNTKIPICEKCGKTMKGRVPIDATHITCYFCNNPPFDDEEAFPSPLKYSDKRD
jgi:hypothetical protein